MLKQAFRQNKELQEEVVQLSNIFRDRLDDLVNSFDEEYVIIYHQRRNAISPWILAIERNRLADYFIIEKRATGRNRVVGHSRVEERAVRWNRVASHSEIEKGAIERNRVASNSEMELKIEAANDHLLNIRFFIEE